MSSPYEGPDGGKTFNQLFNKEASKDFFNNHKLISRLKADLLNLK